MKDSQRHVYCVLKRCKYIKANNERFSTSFCRGAGGAVSISRRIMKDSQLILGVHSESDKYIKANNERFST